MKEIFLIICTFIRLSLVAQVSEAITDSIVMEGKLLYRLEMTSWQGTDLFFRYYQGRRPKAVGYFSYINEDKTCCVFFDEYRSAVSTFTFDSTFSIKTANVDLNSRHLTEYETSLLEMQAVVKKLLDEDTTFKKIPNTSLNIIPIIEPKRKRTYIITGPTVDGLVVYGNDYLILFDNDNKVTYKKSIHSNVIPLYQQEIGHADRTMHTHSLQTGDFMTSTDICITMLYGHLSKWLQHLVFSDRFVSIWDCKTNKLTVFTKRVWDDMHKQSYGTYKYEMEASIYK